MNLGFGGEGARGGLGEGLGGRSMADAVLLDGGGAGGGPRLAVLVLLPVFCGLKLAPFWPGGGGGGALCFFSASA